MTNETQKRNNRLNTIATLDLAKQEEVLQKLAEVQEEVNNDGAVIYDVSGVIDDSGNVDFSKAATHDLQIIPTFSSDENKKLVNVALALTPKFDEVLKSEIGLKYLSDSYFAKVVKRIRDNLRQAIYEGREYKIPVDVADFLAPSRQPSQSNELKKAIAELVKMLIAKFATKYPYAKPLLTAKTMTSAIANESFAKQVYPFLIGKDGKTILDKWLANTKEAFAKNGLPTSEIDSLIETRHNVEVSTDESEADSLDDLF